MAARATGLRSPGEFRCLRTGGVSPTPRSDSWSIGYSAADPEGPSGRGVMRAIRLIILLFVAHPAVAADLKVLKTGLGAGTVDSVPAGISCGATCDATYGTPVSVTLTATPDPGSSFTRWIGDCSGTATTCPLTLDADRYVRAEFGVSTAIPTLTS